MAIKYANRQSDILCGEGKAYSDLEAEVQGEFDRYELNITMINQLDADESIEHYYALVNSTGLRVNRPEIFKAEYHDTRFLRLITEMAYLPKFSDLKLFTQSKQNRMEDLDFVSELLALIKHGITDKKDIIDSIFDIIFL